MASIQEERIGERSPLLKRTKVGDDNEKYTRESPGSHPTLDPGPQTQVYTRRWYVLFVFSLLSMAQAYVWNTWSPVSDSATLVFGWSGADIGLFANMGNIAFCFTIFGASYIIDVLGLRVGVLSMAAMLVVGTVIRCITSHSTVLFWMSMIAGVLSGVAATVNFAGPALFSSVWFPPSQRATATAIINTFTFLGVSASFLVGPAIVHHVDPDKNSTSNYTIDYNNLDGDDLVFLTTGNTTHNHTDSVIDKQRDEIMLYMYVDAAIMGFLFLLVLVYFPSKPPLPPSLSASTSRLDFKKGLSTLAKNRSFWCLALAYAIPSGLFWDWSNILNVNLQPHHVSQATVGQIGLYYNLAGGLCGLIVARCSDLFSRHMKQILIALTVLAAGSLWWIIMLMEQYIPFNLPSLFAAAILASIFINGGVALYYELSSEMCYPVAEGVIGGCLTILNQMMGIIFLALLYIPNIGTNFMNWTMFGGTLFALPLLFLVKAQYQRLRVDCGEIDPSNQAEQHSPTGIDTNTDPGGNIS